jgi:hypothetical protein
MTKKGEQEKKNIKDCIMPPFTTKLEKPCDTTPKTMLMWFVHDKKINNLNHCSEVLNYLLRSIRYKKLSKTNESPSTIISQHHFMVH